MIHVLLTSSYHGNIMTPLRFSLAFVFLGSRSFFFSEIACTSLSCLGCSKVWTNYMRAFWKLKTTVSRYSWSAREMVSEEVTRELAYLVTALKGSCCHGKKISKQCSGIYGRKKNEKKRKKNYSIARQCKWPPLSRKIVENQKFATMVTWRHISPLYCASINKAEKYFGHV